MKTRRCLIVLLCGIFISSIFLGCNARTVSEDSFTIMVPRAWKKMNISSNNLDALQDMIGFDIEEMEKKQLFLQYDDASGEMNFLFIGQTKIPAEYQKYSIAQMIKEMGLGGSTKPAQIGGKQFYIYGRPLGFDGMTAGAFTIHKNTFYSFIAVGSGESTGYVEQVIKSIKMK